jgi:hypothetical protein
MIFRGLFALILTLLSSSLFAFDELKFATSLGLELVSEGHPYNFMGVNTMYVNDTLGRQMMVVSSVPGELKEMRIIQRKGFLIVEIPRDATTYVSMALVGITEQEVKDHVKTTSVWKKIFQELNPLPSAYSNECGIQGAAILHGIEEMASYYGSVFGKGALQCISSFLQGVWDATGGQIQDIGEGIANLVRDPGAFWDRKVQELKNLKEFIYHFDTKIKQMVVGIANLPAETKTQMICSFIGGIGADAAMAIIAGGAGVGKILFRLEEYVTKIARLEKVFALLSKAGKLRNVPIGFYERLTSGALPARLMDNLNTFAHHNLTDVIQGAMSCAL